MAGEEDYISPDASAREAELDFCAGKFLVGVGDYGIMSNGGGNGGRELDN